LGVPFVTVELHFLSVRFLTVFFFPSNFARWALPWIFHHPRKSRAFVGSRTQVLSFRSPKFFHCASQPRLCANIINYRFFQIIYGYQLFHGKFFRFTDKSIGSLGTKKSVNYVTKFDNIGPSNKILEKYNVLLIN
jgi:hypothetical protein